eukprot:6175810-Pleurochrysis_carterae.AAC.5
MELRDPERVPTSSMAAAYIALLAGLSAAWSPSSQCLVHTLSRCNPCKSNIAARPTALPRHGLPVAKDSPDDEIPSQKGGKGGTGMDWDTAWQTELQRREEGQPIWRPEGREPVSEEDLLKARVQAKVDDATSELMQMTKTWQFWVGVLGLISILTAVAGLSGQDASNTAQSFAV